MDSYRQAYSEVLRLFPRAHIAETGSETDSVFIVPPLDPESEGAPTYLVSKDDGTVSQLNPCLVNWDKFAELYDDPSCRPVSVDG